MFILHVLNFLSLGAPPPPPQKKKKILLRPSQFAQSITGPDIVTVNGDVILQEVIQKEYISNENI
jgi:hypothetical protein